MERPRGRLRREGRSGGWGARCWRAWRRRRAAGPTGRGIGGEGGEVEVRVGEAIVGEGGDGGGGALGVGEQRDGQHCAFPGTSKRRCRRGRQRAARQRIGGLRRRGAGARGEGRARRRQRGRRRAARPRISGRCQRGRWRSRGRRWARRHRRGRACYGEAEEGSSRAGRASLVLYGVANVTARRGCIRGDGAVKQALVYVAAVMLQRAFWATVPSPDPTPFSPPSPPPRSPWKVPNTLDLCGFSAAAACQRSPSALAGRSVGAESIGCPRRATG